QVVTPPSGLSEWTTDVDMRPAKPFLVRITAKLDKTTGKLTWKFATIDPKTGDLPEDPLLGFLPPNKTTPEGEGSVLYTVNAKPGLPTGTQIQAQARIVFDVNAPIDTNVWSNTLDNTPPTSAVTTSGIPQNGVFLLRWSGSDRDSGLRDYTIFVSDN